MIVASCNLFSSATDSSINLSASSAIAAAVDASATELGGSADGAEDAPGTGGAEVFRMARSDKGLSSSSTSAGPEDEYADEAHACDESSRLLRSAAAAAVS